MVEFLLAAGRPLAGQSLRECASASATNATSGTAVAAMWVSARAAWKGTLREGECCYLQGPKNPSAAGTKAGSFLEQIEGRLAHREPKGVGRILIAVAW